MKKKISHTVFPNGQTKHPSKPVETAKPEVKSNKFIANSSISVVGFDSLNDVRDTMLAPASGKFLTVMSIIGGLSSFISGYIYSDPKAIYFLVGLMVADCISGVANAIKKGEFSSRRLPRILGVLVAYMTVLSLGTHMAKFNQALDFLPGVIFFGLSSVLSVSIIENINALGLLPKELASKILDIIKSKK